MLHSTILKVHRHPHIVPYRPKCLWLVLWPTYPKHDQKLATMAGKYLTHPFHSTRHSPPSCIPETTYVSEVMPTINNTPSIQVHDPIHVNNEWLMLPLQVPSPSDAIDSWPQWLQCYFPCQLPAHTLTQKKNQILGFCQTWLGCSTVTRGIQHNFL